MAARAFAYPLAVAIIGWMAGAAQATLLHEWQFNDGTANDTAVGGTAHGTLGGNAQIVAGSLVLDGSAGSVVNFPAPSIAINTYPSITLEVWATPAAVDGFRTLVGFGEVNQADTTQATNYFILQPQRGDNVTRAAISANADTTAGAFGREDFADGAEKTDGLQHFYAAVISGPTATTDPNTIKLYIDGQLQTTRATIAPFAPGIYPVGAAGGGNAADNMISAIATGFATVGSAYPVDPLYQGTVNNIRLYNEARTGLQITLANNAGPPGLQGPRLTINRTTGEMTLSNLQPASQMVGYSITSTAGSLNSTAWVPIADTKDGDSGGSFDDTKWTKLSAAGSKTDFSEFEFDGGNGGAFGGGGTTSLAIGTAGTWRKSIYEDIAVQMRLADGTSVPVQLVYTGGGPSNTPYKRSDLNFDNSVNIADYNIFLAHSGASFSAMSQAESYVFGDLNGDLVSDRLDFRLFKADYNAVNGAGSFELAFGVPEPSTLALLMLSGVGFLPRRARTRLSRSLGNAFFSRRPATRGFSLATLLVVLGVVAALASNADAALKNRYMFNEGATADASGRTIVDSVGGMNGVIKGAGSSATANHLTLTGGPSDTAAYVDLPNHMISGLTNMTLEGWYTINADPANPTLPFSWGRVYDFGSTSAPTAVNGELTAPGGAGNGLDQVFYAPNRGTNIAQQRVSISNQDPLFGGASAGDFATGVYNDFDPEFVHQLGVKYHFATVFDSTGGGTGQPTMAFYINGALVADAGGQANPFPINYSLGNINDVNNWLGRSNWTADGNFGGSFDEFRIYDNALSATDVAADFILGEDIVGSNVVSLEVNRSTGDVKIKNNVSVDLPIEHYQVNSPAGALNLAGWTSIDGNTPVGTGWDKAGGSTNKQISELYLPDDVIYNLPANGEVDLGAAYNPSIFGAGDGDLTFLLGHVQGAALTGQVVYVGTPAGLPGDYNGDMKVDAADYTVWRDHLGDPTEAALHGNGSNSGGVDAADYTLWKSKFGTHSGSGSGSLEGGNVPEPSDFALLIGGLLAIGAICRCNWTRWSHLVAPSETSMIHAGGIHLGRERRQTMLSYENISHSTRPIVALLVCVVLATAGRAATKDRFYQFGDDTAAGETPSLNANPTSTFGALTLDSATIPGGPGTDFQDLSYEGDGPKYTHTDTTSRPGAVSGEWGLNFDGVNDDLFISAGGLGSPAVGDNGATYAGLDYTGITTRLIDGWVRPTNAAAGHRQDVVNDTSQFGIFISADNKWGFVEGTASVTSDTPVVFNQWTHVMHRTYTNDAGALYVNGVAVAATGTNYNAAPAATAPTADIVFGASATDPRANFFQGQLDNFSILISGNNSTAASGNGHDYGAVNVATDNDYIRQQLVGIQAGDVNLSGGAPNATDVSIFVAHWLNVRQVNGINVGGDLTSRMWGDFNLNGTVDIDDAYTLHAALVAAGAGGLDFRLLGSNVPEPSTLLLAAWALAALRGRRRRR